MTRAEEISKAAEKELKDCPYINTSLIGFDFFIKGAKWADANPNKDNMATAYKVGEAAAIAKACEWLTRELCYTARGINLFNNKTATDEFVESFKQAMKGGEE